MDSFSAARLGLDGRMSGNYRVDKEDRVKLGADKHAAKSYLTPSGPNMKRRFSGA
jgi:hypothetical protein